MEKVTRMKKEKVNWPITILLFFIAILFIFGPLYMTIVIALKSPQEMGNVLTLPKKIQWSNFVKAWEMTDYPRKFANTLFITLVNLVFTVFTNAMASYAIARNRKKSKFFNLL